MKKLLSIAIALITLTAFTIGSDIWKSDPPHSQLGFTVNHLGINNISGTFNDFEVTVKTSKQDFSDASFELEAKTASIDTRVADRDHHLNTADFFDSEKFPTIKFISTSIKSSGKNKYKVIGNLTLHGVTKVETLDIFYRGTAENPMNEKQTAGFQVTGVIKRSDYGIGEKFPAPMLSDEVRIEADGEFLKN